MGTPVRGRTDLLRTEQTFTSFDPVRGSELQPSTRSSSNIYVWIYFPKLLEWNYSCNELRPLWNKRRLYYDVHTLYVQISNATTEITSCSWQLLIKKLCWQLRHVDLSPIWSSIYEKLSCDSDPLWNLMVWPSHKFQDKFFHNPARNQTNQPVRHRAHSSANCLF